VWDQGDEFWYGEDGDSPYPLGVLHPDMPLDCVLDGDEDDDPSWQSWMPLMSSFIGKLWLCAKRPKV
jgi:hypothetical protein